MRKKGVFVTLTAVILLAVIIFIVMVSYQQTEEINEINIQYTEHKVMADHINRMKDIYLPTLIRTSAKYALIELSTSGSSDLKKDMQETMMGQNSRLPTDKTLPFYVNTTFNALPEPLQFTYINLTVLDITQPDNWTIEMNSRVSFQVNSTSLGSKISWNMSQDYTSQFLVLGLFNRKYNRYITGKWQTNDTEPCMLSLVTSYVCNFVYGQHPLN